MRQNLQFSLGHPAISNKLSTSVNNYSGRISAILFISFVNQPISHLAILLNGCFTEQSIKKISLNNINTTHEQSIKQILLNGCFTLQTADTIQFSCFDQKIVMFFFSFLYHHLTIYATLILLVFFFFLTYFKICSNISQTC